MKVTYRQLRTLIKEEISQILLEKRRDKTLRHKSELAYARGKSSGSRRNQRSRKSKQRAAHKAHRATADEEILSQIMDMGPLNLDTIGDLVPIGAEQWAELDGPTEESKRLDILSEKEAYLIDLAWDLASERVEMSDEDFYMLIDALRDTYPDFQTQLSYAYDEKRVEEDMDDAFNSADGNLVDNFTSFAKKIRDIEVQSVPGYPESASDEDYANFQALWTALLSRGYTEQELLQMSS